MEKRKNVCKECFLTNKEIDKLLEPIKDHGHCYGEIAETMIKNAKKEKALLCYRKKTEAIDEAKKDGKMLLYKLLQKEEGCYL